MFFSKVGKSSVKITSNGMEAKMQANGKHGNINQTITNSNDNTQTINYAKESSLHNPPGLLRVELRYLDSSQDMIAYVRQSELVSRNRNNWIDVYDKSGTTLGTVSLRLVKYIKYLDLKG